MTIVVEQGSFRSIFTAIFHPERQQLTASLEVYRGRFRKIYYQNISLSSQEGLPYEFVWENLNHSIFRHVNAPQQLEQFTREYHEDEMRREGYYRALDQMSTGTQVFESNYGM